jgi:hypothetical protein
MDKKKSLFKMVKMTFPNIINKEKLIIGDYRVIFKTEFNETVKQDVTLKIKLSKDLQKLIQSLSVNETVESIYSSGRGHEVKYKRYKFKTDLFMTIDYISLQFKEIIFNKTLVDTGEIEIDFKTIASIEYFIDSLKTVLQTIILNILKSNKTKEIKFV